MFTARISMDCDQQQYEKFLKPELLKMGYKITCLYWGKEQTYIATNCDDENGNLINGEGEFKTRFGRTYLGTFNAPLFLALAAMTDQEWGCYREWFTVKGIFVKRAETGRGWLFEDGKMMPDSLVDYLIRATVSEIMEKFGEKQLTNLDKLAARVEKLEKCTIIQKEYPPYRARVFDLDIKAEPKTIPVSGKIFLHPFAILWPAPYQKCLLCEGSGEIDQDGIQMRCHMCDGKGKKLVSIRLLRSESEPEAKVGSVLEEPLIKAVPYQLCPKCEGRGIIGGTAAFDSELGHYYLPKVVCDLCNGKMMIPMHVTEK